MRCERSFAKKRTTKTIMKDMPNCLKGEGGVLGRRSDFELAYRTTAQAGLPVTDPVRQRFWQAPFTTHGKCMERARSGVGIAQGHTTVSIPPRASCHLQPAHCQLTSPPYHVAGCCHCLSSPPASSSHLAPSLPSSDSSTPSPPDLAHPQTATPKTYPSSPLHTP